MRMLREFLCPQKSSFLWIFLYSVYNMLIDVCLGEFVEKKFVYVKIF